ncbi:NADH:ubiquinone oxidoreductase subunit N [Paenibacillus pectinilyticus]|uniref:NADH-quinone oxidoreductase subunit N n=1 Tax=Paenibacillus pectinilyticus TaxID=512399 RepID=A0A1C0ZYB7_9BACL|nr:NADH-quinone oxidoreductase subunit N [Paenibacillus pectinilyticus]OCT13119.1 NADH:ubiquinone oxidoreductase subunit N [Paenibacillus pectinilyticus]
MEQIRLHVADLTHLLPELALIATAIILSLLDLVLPNRFSRSIIGWLTLVGIAVSAVFVVLQLNPDEAIQLLNQSYRIDDFSNILKLCTLVGTGLIVFMSLGFVKEDSIPHVGEYYYFYLPAALGAMIMSSSGDMITLYVGLELLSITSYLLVAMKKKDSKSNEGAFKYLVMGGISSAIILYGMSFLYGMVGSTNLQEIGTALPTLVTSYEPLLYVAFFMLLAGFGFKIAAAPFHSWAPDVYEGAPTPVTAFLAVVSKAAGFAILFRVFYVLFGFNTFENTHLQSDVFLAISVMAAVAMVTGNFIALKQSNMKRLLAYSGIANAGYLLVPIGTYFSATHYGNFSEFIFYLSAYVFMNIGAFAVLMIIEQAEGHTEAKGFAGLYYRAPLTAVAMVLLILSLAGIPLSGGFFGKLYIILGTMETHQYWLGALMIATSVVSFYYYFSIIRQMFMRSDYEPALIKVSVPLGITVWLCALISVALGVVPHVVLKAIESIFTLTKDFILM